MTCQLGMIILPIPKNLNRKQPKNIGLVRAWIYSREFIGFFFMLEDLGLGRILPKPL